MKKLVINVVVKNSEQAVSALLTKRHRAGDIDGWGLWPHLPEGPKVRLWLRRSRCTGSILYCWSLQHSNLGLSLKDLSGARSEWSLLGWWLTIKYPAFYEFYLGYLLDPRLMISTRFWNNLSFLLEDLWVERDCRNTLRPYSSLAKALSHVYAILFIKALVLPTYIPGIYPMLLTYELSDKLFRAFQTT